MKLTRAAIIGQLLLWIGFLGGALAAVFRLEDSSAPWQTIPWSMYLAGAAVGIVGVVVLRQDKAAHRLKSAESGADLDSVVRNLREVAKTVAEFAANIDGKTCEQVLEFIDDNCEPLLTDFGDSRMVIANRFGSSTYAKVMTEFASGERYLNRAWSAAADGYVDEVTLSIQHASDFLAAADRDLQAAREQTI